MDRKIDEMDDFSAKEETGRLEVLPCSLRRESDSAKSGIPTPEFFEALRRSETRTVSCDFINEKGGLRYSYFPV